MSKGSVIFLSVVCGIVLFALVLIFVLLAKSFLVFRILLLAVASVLFMVGAAGNLLVFHYFLE